MGTTVNDNEHPVLERGPHLGMLTCTLAFLMLLALWCWSQEVMS